MRSAIGRVNTAPNAFADGLERELLAARVQRAGDRVMAAGAIACSSSGWLGSPTHSVGAGRGR
jgi:hypothetical protein